MKSAAHFVETREQKLETHAVVDIKNAARNMDTQMRSTHKSTTTNFEQHTKRQQPTKEVSVATHNQNKE